MGATEDTFASLAHADGLVFTRKTRLPWLTNRGHLAASFADDAVTQSLREIYHALGGNEQLLANKRAGSDPEIDFWFPDEQLLVETDEIQHFTSDRLRTLELYPEGVDVLFDVDNYRELIKTWCSTANRYRATKPCVDFPFAGGRRAQRAYFDAVRDLGAPAYGLRVLRVSAPECNGVRAYERFNRVFAQL